MTSWAAAGAKPPEVGLAVDLELQVPDDVLLDEVLEEALVHVVHDRGSER